MTRPADRSGALAGLLREQGAEVLEIPSIRTRIRDVGAQLLEVLAQIETYRYVVFTSPAGVEYFFELLDWMELDVRCLGQVKIAAIGSATGSALKKHGLRPELMPDRYHSKALGELLHASLEDGDRVLLLRSSIGSRELVAQIQAEKDIGVTDLAISDTVCPGDMTQAAWLDEGEIDLVMFTSASTVRGFVEMTQGADYTKVRAVCIGQVTADQAALYGMQVHICEKETIEHMADCAAELFKTMKL